MSARISPRQWELLCAYLDCKCTPREKTAIERDLAAHPELRQALAELTRLRTVLRSVPMRKPRRNFTLKPGQIAARRAFSWAPVLRYASLTAILAAVVMLAIDLLPGMTAAPRAAAPQAVSAPMMEAAADQAVTEGAPIIYWNGVAPNAPSIAGGYGGGGGGGAEGPGIGGGAPEVNFGTIATSTPAAVEPMLAAPPVAESIAQPTASADVQREAQPATSPEAEQPVGKSSSEGPILGIRPTEEQGTFITTTTEAAAPTAANPLPIPRFIGLGLGALAVILLVAAYFLRKRA